MSTTLDTNQDSVILTIDEAAAYLAIPKATLYTWRNRRVGFGTSRGEDGRLPPLPALGPRRLGRRASRACRERVGPWPSHLSPSARGEPSLPRRSATAATEP